MTGLARFEDAARECGLSLTADDTNPGAYYLLGVSREELGELPEAQMSFEQAIYLAPNFSMAHLRRAVLARRLGQASVAARALASALTAIAQDDPRAAAAFCWRPLAPGS